MTGQLNIRTGNGGQGLSIGDSRGQGIIYITGYDKTNYCALFNDSSNSFTETRHLYLPNKTGTLALTSDTSNVVYYEDITGLNGSKTISNIPFKSLRRLYLVCWTSDYPANDSGAWLVFTTPISGQTKTVPLYEHHITMTASGTTATLNQTSSNPDNGRFYVMELTL